MCGTFDCDRRGDLFDPTKCAPRKEITNEKRPDDEPTNGEINDDEPNDVLSDFKHRVSVVVGILETSPKSVTQRALKSALNSFEEMAEQDLETFKEALSSQADVLFNFGKDAETKYFHREMLGLVDNLDFGETAYVMLALCPTPAKSYGGEVHFSMKNDELPPDFDPQNCPSTLAVLVIEENILGSGAFLVKINIRDECLRQKNDRNCKAPTAAECTPRALLLNLLGMAYTAVGGGIHFANVGGPAINTVLVIMSISGEYHISLMSSMNGGLLGNEEEHIEKMSASVKEMCDNFQLPEMYSELVDKCRYLEDISNLAEVVNRLKENREKKETRLRELKALRKLPRNSEERTSGLLRMKSEDDSGFCNEERCVNGAFSRSSKCTQHGDEGALRKLRLKEEREKKETRLHELKALRKLPRNSEERTSGLLRMKSEDDSGFCNEESKPSVSLFDFYCTNYSHLILDNRVCEYKVQLSGKCTQHMDEGALMKLRLKEESERLRELKALRKLPRNSEERTSGLLRMKSEDDSGFCNEERCVNKVKRSILRGEYSGNLPLLKLKLRSTLLFNFKLNFFWK